MQLRRRFRVSTGLPLEARGMMPEKSRSARRLMETLVRPTPSGEF